MTSVISKKVTYGLILLALVCGSSLGEAKTSTKGNSRSVAGKIRSFVKNNNLPTFTHHGKLHLAVSHYQEYMRDYTRLGSNLVEFLVDAGHEHLYTRVGKTEYDRTGTSARRGSLNKEPWTLNYAQKRISVLVELKPKQMRRLTEYLVAARGFPIDVMGEWSYQGGLPPRKCNCTSFIVRTPIGDKGEHMHEVCGVPFLAKGLQEGYSPLGHPQSWLNSLIRSKKAAVRAVVVHNHEGDINDAAVDLSN